MKDETKRRGGGRGERGTRVIHSRKFLSFQFQKFHSPYFSVHVRNELERSSIF